MPEIDEATQERLEKEMLIIMGLDNRMIQSRSEWKDLSKPEIEKRLGLKEPFHAKFTWKLAWEKMGNVSRNWTWEKTEHEDGQISIISQTLKCLNGLAYQGWGRTEKEAFEAYIKSMESLEETIRKIKAECQEFIEANEGDSK
jgi:hypothetical protein